MNLRGASLHDEPAVPESILHDAQAVPESFLQDEQAVVPESFLQDEQAVPESILHDEKAVPESILQDEQDVPESVRQLGKKGCMNLLQDPSRNCITVAEAFGWYGNNARRAGGVRCSSNGDCPAGQKCLVAEWGQQFWCGNPSYDSACPMC